MAITDPWKRAQRRKFLLLAREERAFGDWHGGIMGDAYRAAARSLR